MTGRRIVLCGGLLFLAGAGAAASTFGRQMQAGKPKLIKGHPDAVDFGHGLIVPMSQDAFRTLWEGDDRWMAYGHGIGQTASVAMGRAEDAAIATMKLFLITLAFAPDRLIRVAGGGWRLKSGRTADLIQGDIDLPGRPVLPATDKFNSFLEGETGDAMRGEDGSHATTGWVVWKSEVTLDTVRRIARLVPSGL